MQNKRIAQQLTSTLQHAASMSTTTNNKNNVSAATAITKRAKIILFGDSITQQSFSAVDSGWGAHLADRYQRRADVVNRGFSGYNTGWFLQLAATEYGKADLFDHDNVQLVTIFFGANDASHPTWNERQHVPLPQYQSNLKEIVSLTRLNFGADVNIIIISPPPVCHEGRLRYQKSQYKENATGKLERTLELSGQYAQGAGEVAKELNLPFIDLWTKMQFSPCTGEETAVLVERTDWRTFLSDGLHFSAAGNKYVGETILQVIDQVFPDLSVQPCPETRNINSSSTCPSVPKIGPWHNEIDHTEPGESF
jgi:lysophospholipase L1-like esterase